MTMEFSFAASTAAATASGRTTPEKLSLLVGGLDPI